MGISLVIGPASDPVSLSEARDHCRLDNNESDGLLAGYVLAARRYAENYTRRAFITQTWDATFDGDWPRERGVPAIWLPLPPLASVTSVTYVDDGGQTQTLPSDQYRVLTDGTFGRIVPADGVSWPTVRRQDNAITVRFVAGWDPSAVPDSLRVAILMLVSFWYENRETINVGNLTTELPFATEALLSQYRVLRIL